MFNKWDRYDVIRDISILELKAAHDIDWYDLPKVEDPFFAKFAVRDHFYQSDGVDGSAYFVKAIDGYGKVVYIRHADGVITRYSHLDSQAVAKGQFVTQGQVIGTVGVSGNVPVNGQPHLHYEVVVDWQRIDPAQVGMGEPIRFLRACCALVTCGLCRFW